MTDNTSEVRILISKANGVYQSGDERQAMFMAAEALTKINAAGLADEASLAGEMVNCFFVINAFGELQKTLTKARRDMEIARQMWDAGKVWAAIETAQDARSGGIKLQYDSNTGSEFARLGYAIEAEAHKLVDEYTQAV